MIKTMHKFKLPNFIKIPYFGGKNYEIISKLEYKELLKIKDTQLSVNEEKRKVKIIASLTSFPDRIKIVHLTLRTLLNQTIKPDELILWLSSDQFENKNLPEELTRLCNFGLQIKWCDDLKSHKKYYYALKENENDIIVTFDDDIIYPENYLEKLYNKHLQFPSAVICNQALKISLKKDGTIESYDHWKNPISFATKEPELLMMPIGCGGVLYPPKSLNNEVFNTGNILKYALTVDDIWLKFMAVMNNTKTIKTSKYNKTLSCIPNSQSTHLAQVNCLQGKNDVSLNDLLKVYPNIYQKLRDEDKREN